MVSKSQRQYNIMPITLLLLLMIINITSISSSAYIPQLSLYNRYGMQITISVDNKTYIIMPGSNIKIDHSSMICVSDHIIPISEFERLKFIGWLVNNKLIKSNCINTSNISFNSTLEPFYLREYIVTVVSDPYGLFYYKSWHYSGFINISIPLILERENAKYILQNASSGFLYIDAENNRSVLSLSVSYPLSVIVYYKPIYKVEINLEKYELDNIILWSEKNNIIITSIPVYIYKNNDTKLILTDISAVNADVRILTSDGIVEIRVLGPNAKVFPLYTVYYLVVYETASGIVEKWVKDGDQITINAYAQYIQDENREYRLVFEKWEGDVESLSPVISIVVDRPLRFKAVYNVEWKVTVDSLIGTKEYWVPDGETQVIFVPPELPGVLIGRQLDFYLVNGRPVDPGPGGFLKLGPVKEPVHVVAIYKGVILWNNIAVLAGLLIGVVLIYIAYDMYVSRLTGEEEDQEKEEPEKPRDETREEPSEPSVGPWAS